MGWNIIRKAVADDWIKLDRRAKAFIERHDLDTSGYGSVKPRAWQLLEDTLDSEIEGHGPERDYYIYLRQLWKRVVARALDHSDAEGIAWGCVGYHVD